MQLTNDRVRLAAMIAMAVGFVIIVVMVLSLVLGGSDDQASDQGDSRGSTGLQPYDPGLAEVAPAKSFGKDSSDPFKAKDGSSFFDTSTGGNEVRKVEIRFKSDGALYAGWRYRTKGGEGSKVASKSLTVSKTVKGGLPTAVAAVQALSTATYATCTIYVDGVVVSTQTAKGANHVTVCVG